MLPADVTIRKDPAKPYLAVLDLSSSVAAAFESSGLGALLGFGTAAPPSPLAQLERCLVDPPSTPFSSLVSGWVGVLQAAREGTLGSKDRATLVRMAQLNGIPGRTSGGFTVGCTVDIRRVYGRPDGSADTGQQPTLPPTESLNARANRGWNEAGWLIRVTDPAFSLCSHAEELCAIMSVPSTPPPDAPALFLSWVAEIGRQHAATPLLLDAFTLAVHAELRANGVSRTKARVVLQFAKAGWAKLAAVAMPVVNDDASKWEMIQRASRLRDDLNFDPVVLFNHTSGMLATLDAGIIRALKIPRLSSSDFKVTVKSIGDTADAPAASQMVRVVLDMINPRRRPDWLRVRVKSATKLERSMVLPRVGGGNGGGGGGGGSSKRQPSPSVSLPPVVIESFSAWDGNSDTVFICGDPSDFVMDLQESVLLKARGVGIGYGGGAEVVRQNRVLSLLFHCLSEKTFVKVFLRSFPDDKEVLQAHELPIVHALVERAPKKKHEEAGDEHQDRKRKARSEDGANVREVGSEARARLETKPPADGTSPPSVPAMAPPSDDPPPRSSTAKVSIPAMAPPSDPPLPVPAMAPPSGDPPPLSGTAKASIPAMAPPSGPPPAMLAPEASVGSEADRDGERPAKFQRMDPVMMDAGPPPPESSMLGPPPPGSPPTATGAAGHHVGGLDAFLANAKQAAEAAMSTTAKKRFAPPFIVSGAAAAAAATAEAVGVAQEPAEPPAAPSYMPRANVSACLSAAAAAVDTRAASVSSFWIAVGKNEAGKWMKLGFKPAPMHPPPPPGPTVQLCLDADLPPS